MKSKPVTITDLAKKIESLELQQQNQLEALKLLLPIAIAIPASTPTSGQAVKELKAALAAIEDTKPRSEDFWYLASAMALLLSSKAAAQHPDDPEVIAIHHGLRAHRMQ